MEHWISKANGDSSPHLLKGETYDMHSLPSTLVVWSAKAEIELWNIPSCRFYSNFIMGI